jgi:hypothetical protein
MTHPFFKVFLTQKNLEIDLLDGFVPFFDGYPSSAFPKRLFTSSSNICAIKE